MILMRRVLMLASLVLVTSSCAAFSNDGSSNGGVQVVAAFYPLAYATERIGGAHVDVTNLTQPGKEPHDLELTIKETAEVADADLVVHESGFQPPVDAAIDANATGDVLDAADVVDLQPLADEPSEIDPHFWQDPARMADLGDALADKLAGIDPANKDDYLARAAAFRDDMTQLDQSYADGLASCDRNTIVVSHDAFGYLAKFGLHIEGIAGLSPDAEPTPADLARLQDLIRADGITTVFSERLVSPRLTETLANDLGIRTEVLDPIEGLSDQTSTEDYRSLMQENLTALEQANGCR
jgi:zinc transport system substrate-binding protein